MKATIRELRTANMYDFIQASRQKLSIGTCMMALSLLHHLCQMPHRQIGEMLSVLHRWSVAGPGHGQPEVGSQEQKEGDIELALSLGSRFLPLNGPVAYPGVE
jgi:hypothetical protein